MDKPKLPTNQTELRALKDEDLEKARAYLEREATHIRSLRKVFALEAERRSLLPKPALKAEG